MKAIDRCRMCSREFGSVTPAGFVVYRFDVSNICTECLDWEKRTNSRDYDQQYVNSFNGRRRYR